MCLGDPMLEADEVGLRLVDTTRVHWLPVVHNRAQSSPLKDAGVVAACVMSSRWGTVDDVRLAEFVSHYLQLGVSHFVFYNQTETRRSRRFLSAASSTTSFSVNYLSWSLHIARDMLPYDCALRMRYRVEVLLVVEEDEFLIIGPDYLSRPLSRASEEAIQLPRKNFCRDSEGGYGMRLSRTRRRVTMGEPRLTVVGLETLLAGVIKPVQANIGVVHR